MSSAHITIKSKHIGLSKSKQWHTREKKNNNNSTWYRKCRVFPVDTMFNFIQDVLC